ncbi:hypothetical protein [Nannocystis pusilla]|uniref:hypothetical protein n=1 Tax=Nannocystis pusilla TaxID=889268 RepID=UPI003DA5332F
MRSFAESCALLDSIVGRCVREPEFAERVLDEPEAALAAYGLARHELDDFLALAGDHKQEAAETWAAIRAGIEARRRARRHPRG